MKTFEGVQFLARRRPLVATVGMFDGVHRGHRALIAHLLRRATELRGTAALISFWPHPRHVLECSTLPLLTSLEERSALLAETSLPYLIILPFTKELAALEKERFIEDVLIRGIGVRHLVVGPSHRFGEGGRGSITDLEARATEGDFSCEAFTSVQIDGRRVSSTAIRKALNDGCLEDAQQLLGYAYTFSGEVIKGDEIGRTIGFPTANLKPPPYKLMPKDGVYAVEVEIDNQWHQGMLYIGKKSIEQPSKHTIEVHVFDLDMNLYGRVLSIRLRSYLRATKSLSSRRVLVQQLEIDRQESLRVLNMLQDKHPT